MSLKERFLKLPLKLQINIFLISIFILTIFLVLVFSQAISLMHFKTIKSKRKEYFLSMERKIIESNLYFINICLLQYENLIKLFNSQIYHFLNDENLFFYFFNKNKIPENISEQKIHAFNNISEVFTYPDYQENSNDKKIFISCDSKNSPCEEAISLIKSNAFIYLNQYKGLRDFKIPFYGEQTLMGEYTLFLKNYQTFLSINNTSIKETFIIGQNASNIATQVSTLMKDDYELNERHLKEYSNNEIKLMQLMYRKLYFILDEYNSINDTFEKEVYLRDKSIYFQSLDYNSDTSFFCNNWNITKGRVFGKSYIISGCLSWILFNIFKKLDIITLPIDHTTNQLISKNLCLYFILKQLIIISVNDENFNETEKYEEIYEKIKDKEITDIDDCKLDKYLDNIGEEFKMKKEFLNYFDLNNIYDSYLYKLSKSESRSYLFQVKSTYPNLECLKLFYSDFFTFYQLDFYTFSPGSNISRIISSSNEFMDNVNYLILLLLWILWLITAFIFAIIIHYVIPKITDPIVRLTQIVNLNANDYKNKKIFEYTLDEDINKFFALCKNLIDGEMINNDLKLKEILEDKSLDFSYNNNMIINNKMILELIESQKCLNDNDKNIFLLKEGNISNKKEKNERKITSPRRKRKNFNVNNLDVIKLISLNTGENMEINTTDSKKIKKANEELYSDVDEEDNETNNLKLYEDLIKIADFVFYGKEKEKINKMRKNVDKNSLISKISKMSKQENTNFKPIRGFDNITYYWYINEKNNKTIRRYTNIYS